MGTCLLLAGALYLGGPGTARAQTLEVIPSRALSEQAVVIRARGLPPGEQVTLAAHLTDGADHQWASQAELLADAQGIVDTSQQAPQQGSYRFPRWAWCGR